jgi:hypothetical protein
MKKFGFMFAFLMIMGVSIFAQSGTGYFDVLPGYQFSSSKVDGGFVASLDGGYFFSDNWGLHMGLQYNEGKFDFGKKGSEKDWWFDKFDEGKGKDSFYIFEIGPELAAKAGKGQVYWQIVNVGHTFGANNNEWSWGTAAGYRYPINENWGLDVQAAYHRVNSWDTNHWDIRTGVVFKF